MSMLTCQGGEITVDSGGMPLCSGTWVGVSSPWGLDLTTEDIAEIWGAALVVFACVWCVKLALRSLSNQR